MTHAPRRAPARAAALLAGVAGLTLLACSGVVTTGTPFPTAMDGTSSSATTPDPRLATLAAHTFPAPETAAAPTAPVDRPPTLAVAGATAAADCPPTAPDALGPFYVPGAPERSAVGSGYVLSGRVLSGAGCTALPGARIEAWLAGPDGDYGDAYRATFFADADGAYRFESHPPPAYGGRPPHIHLRVTAAGHAVLVTQHYPQDNGAGGRFDLVLSPE